MNYTGLDLLTTAVVVLDRRLAVVYLNSAAEQLLSVNRRMAAGHPVQEVIPDGELAGKLAQCLAEQRGFLDPEFTLAGPGHVNLNVSCTATPLDTGKAQLLIELRLIEQHLRIEREAQRASQAQANRELIRNLAHEIKNPLGGLRGSAQLLERELDRPELREYTQVIIKEADRLQALMNRLLTPHRPPMPSMVNIHEVCERVRSLILAEFPEGIEIRRNYDISLPELLADKEQLIQAVLNIVRNAAQAVAGLPAEARREIALTTGVAQRVTLAKSRHKLALELQVCDSGPGIPPPIRDKIFYPLVSGRDGGSGLGLTLAQAFVQHHGGVLEVESEPGRTCFRIVLPLK